MTGLFWLNLPVKGVTGGEHKFTVGRYVIVLDNSKLKVPLDQPWIDKYVNTKMPFTVTWQGKKISVISVWLEQGIADLCVEFDVITNPIPVLGIFAMIGLIGVTGWAAVEILKQIRKLVTFQDLTSNPWGFFILLAGFAAVAIIFVKRKT